MNSQKRPQPLTSFLKRGPRFELGNCISRSTSLLRYTEYTISSILLVASHSFTMAVFEKEKVADFLWWWICTKALDVYAH